MKRTFIRRTTIPASVQTLYDWHMREGAFARLTPPWEHVRMKCKDPTIENGSRVSLEIDAGPTKVNWLAEHRDVQPGKEFTDVQVRGPFKFWKHKHIFEKTNDGCLLTDSIQYELPFDVATIFSDTFIKDKLERMFQYRHEMTKNDIDVFCKHSNVKPMKILVTGSSGLVGTNLVPFLQTQGHDVYTLTRPESSKHSNLTWNPEKEQINSSDLEGFDAVIHLAGENIADAMWTNDKKRRLVESRINSTRLLVDALLKLEKPPSVFVCASAIGFYGNRDNEILTEDSDIGKGFLADLCAKWEFEAARVTQKNIRPVMLRIGVVLTPSGGMLQKILPPFQFGGGGPIGSGNQYMSWISIDDLVSAIYHCLCTKEISGAVNATSPESCTNSEFTKSLGNVLRRPTIFPVPEIALKLAFGEMAEETMLASCRVEPVKLKDSGYKFLYPKLEEALKHVLGK
ncbi:MAG: TIGR01777 family oxidoreductase [Cyanobacteria bacterium TGS_CYA1]|nr:TIGR01777 family oxidoreductase [Cyanobacteria bacterium TGS_CYA1]